MFLNQIHFMWWDLGRAKGPRVASLLIGPLAVFGLLVLLLRDTG